MLYINFLLDPTDIKLKLLSKYHWPLNWNEFTDVSSTIQIAVMAASDMPDNLEEVKKEFSSMKDSEPAA